MNKGIGLGLFIAGLALIYHGFTAPDAVSSSLSRFLPGAPTFKTLWLLFAGSAAVIMGTALTFKRYGGA